jgi:hypothetical protein
MRRGSTYRRLVALIGGALLIGALVPAMPAGAVVAGAGFTTFVDAEKCRDNPTGVNCNNYESKGDVWINGGPPSGPAALTDGTYFFAVLEPGGQSDPNDGGDHVLSDTDPAGGSGTTGGGDPYTNRIFTVSGGDISAYGGTHASCQSNTPGATCSPNDAPNRGLLINLMPYDDTSNPGGVYILAICKIDPATYDPDEKPVGPRDCKYDAFRVEAGDGVTPFGVVSGLKYYDANVNGQHDGGEPGIAGWPIDFENAVSSTVLTDGNGEFELSLVAGQYTFAERQASSPWIQTGNTVNQTSSTGGNSATLNANKTYTVTVVDNGQTTGLNFGNVCVGAGGGRTIGFWSNANGRAQMNDGGTLEPELVLLRALNLRTANGGHFDPTTYTQFRTWLLNATATNMAYMLSAQLAGMALNVEAGFVDGNALIYAPGTTSANAAGFASVNAIMAEANTELGLHGLTRDGSPYRTYQEALKDALDRANNNQAFLQPGPAHCPAPVFPAPVFE